MIVSWNWIKDYIDIGVDVEEYCEKMIMSGSNLETCTEIGTGISGVLVGKVEAIEKHPDADKLVVCKINIGKEEPLQIVTGATNLFQGAIVPVATDGSVVPGPLHNQPKVEGGVTIKSGKLRGVLSEGMLCGCSELGFEDKVAPFESKDGIWILDASFEKNLGEEIDKALDFKDYVIDFEITPNRPDCLSMLGMARETAATLGGKVKYPATDCKNLVGKVEDYISAEVRSDLCKRYTIRVITNVKIQQSPWWFQKRLMSAGVRPINNIVDITNWVMMEYGQPLHAFDIRNLVGHKIIVENAEEGEVFTTLDGKERTLKESMLMIKDGEKSVAIAGVMGGQNSEITEETTTVVLESANFVGSSIRKTSKDLGLRTESSSRYEKGIDPNLCEEAADRFCYLVELLEAGEVAEGHIDIYPNVEKAEPVLARVSRINKVLGTDLSRETMVEILTSLECKVEGEEDQLVVIPPTVRQDLTIEADIVEEVARIYGYDNLPMTLPKGNEIAKQSQSWKLRSIARETLCALGANEIQTFSFVSPATIDKVRIDEDSWERAFVKLINPLGEDTSVMRTILTPSMLEVLSRNFSRKVENVRAFEIGTTFLTNFIEKDGLPDESFSLCIGMYGEDESFYTLKGVVEATLGKLGVKNIAYVAEKEYGIYHPGRCARVIGTLKETGEEIEIGIMGEIHPDVIENYNMEGRVYCCELMLDIVETLSDMEIHYTQPPKYPAMNRDIAVIVSEDTLVGDLKNIISKNGGEHLEKVELFDIYRGEQVGEGKKSLAFSLTYRHKDRTLTDAEIDQINGSVMEALQVEGKGVIRDN